jgi:hypothetical protein
MCAFIVLEDFIARGRVHKVLIIILHIMQVTQTTSLLKIRPNLFFDMGCDHLAPNMAIIFSIHALHLQRLVNNLKH